MIRIINESVNPYFNLALEEYLMKEFDPGEDLFMLWQNRPAVIVGRNQNTWEEINHQFVKENEIAVVRRLTGGGAVYHDLGNLNFTFIARRQKAGQYDFESFARPVVAALRNLGVPAEFSGRNDILVAGKKVSGNAQYRYGSSVLHHGTLLFDTDMHNLVRALHVGREKLVAKGVASVRSRVTNIKEHLPQPLNVEDFRNALVKALFQAEGGQSVEYRLSEGELARVEELVRTKYGTWEWNYGASPGYGLRKSARFDWGKLEVLLDVKDGMIAGCKIYGDFFGREDISGLEEYLTGLPYRERELRQALGKIDLASYVNGLGVESLLRCLLDENEG
ncbi:lipoate-protein ligase A [Thermacetogenium phaeum DSM 12270]|uniref:lipoate--protein ligase n=1 Tax=Thermacetogenium phaeum (strain ATCC BAA-254 / DSM 26808 / PB) TaxID=1089553 RepID=K4LIY4_THEPS|nr:lipoate--protein ligase [Thermacetogenium phaeum]AFV11920.1 lipoate-protein ligase A [Thermacetogenium phaeum DSM 12270]